MSEDFQQQEHYINRGELARDVMADRSVEQQASFFLPHIRSGMDVLDCGCGPGAITVGLAKIVAPGKAFGFDIGPENIDRAIAHAADVEVSNVKFQVADAYELPYDDNAFDAVFSNTVIEHLREPLKALGELHRVLKPGGVIGVRDADWGGYLIISSKPRLRRVIGLARESMEAKWW